MKSFNHVILRLLPFLVSGILLGNFFKVETEISGLVVLVSLVFLIVSYLLGKQRFATNNHFGVLVVLSVFFIGVLIVNLHEQKNWSSHYSKFERLGPFKDYNFQLRVIEVLKPSLYQDKYFVETLSLNDKPVSGKILLNVDKNTLAPILKVDDLLYINTPISEIPRPLNPHQFDYRHYLKKEYVYHQIHTEHPNFLVKESDHPSIKGLAAIIRRVINERLEMHRFSKDQLGIINAILLGQKQDLSKNLYQQYASAGVIHILAVSGLHVGIILFILQFLFRPLDLVRKGRFLKTGLIVMLLWGFAVVAGLSPSVVRAVTMFSIVAIGMNMKRRTNIYNTLAISMFILLLFKPLFIFDVGFQLSYLAVFTIVWIQPMLYKLWSPKLKGIDYFWQIFTVTIAAQAGVAPLSLFYFHQFPGLFFISNIIIIPVLGLILGLGLLVIFLTLINALPELIARLFGAIINKLNVFVGWVAEQEAFIFKDIPFSILDVVYSYLMVIFGIRIFQRPSFNRMLPLLLVILIIQATFIQRKSGSRSSFSILHKTRHSIIGFQNNNVLKTFHSLDSTEFKKLGLINDLKVGEQLSAISSESLRSVYGVYEDVLLIVDSLSVYQVGFKPDIVLLRNSPKINLNRLIDQLDPRLIIADGSNYKSYVSRWEATCRNKKLPFHATAKKEAFTIDRTN